MRGLKCAVGFSVITSALLFLPGCAPCGDWLASITGHCTSECTEHNHSHHSPDADGDSHDESDHTHIGPNGGRLIVLGDEDYHAELMIDHAVAEATVCLLDHTGRIPVAVEQRELTLNIRCHGHPHQITLVAVESTAAGQSSCFRGSSEVLRDECQIDGRLNVIIHGKPYSGRVAHHADDHTITR